MKKKSYINIQQIVSDHETLILYKMRIIFFIQAQCTHRLSFYLPTKIIDVDSIWTHSLNSDQCTLIVFMLLLYLAVSLVRTLFVLHNDELRRNI